MDIINTELMIRSHILKITNITPEILFRENSKSILVLFQGNIPDETTTKAIEKELKIFGSIVPNHFRKSEPNCVSFVIHC